MTDSGDKGSCIWAVPLFLCSSSGVDFCVINILCVTTLLALQKSELLQPCRRLQKSVYCRLFTLYCHLFTLYYCCLFTL